MNPGDIISYLDMSNAEGVNLQRGMNFRLGGKTSIILMSVRTNAPYADRIEDNGRTLIYEGHDIPRHWSPNNPKTVDQPMRYPGGSPTQNGLFYEAAIQAKNGKRKPEKVRVYEKIREGIWVYNGVFELIDSWIQPSDGRNVFKFKLVLSDDQEAMNAAELAATIEHSRMIPSSVKQEVWKRDGGKCAICGSKQNLHFDHIIPFSKGGSSLVADNIQLLCAVHNLAKKDRIE